MLKASAKEQYKATLTTSASYNNRALILHLLEESTLGNGKDKKLATALLKKYYPKYYSLAQRHSSIYKTIQKGLTVFFGLLHNDFSVFNRDIDRQKLKELSTKIIPHIKNDVFLPTLIMTNYYGMLTDSTTMQYHSMRDALSEYFESDLGLPSAKEMDFAKFALRYSNSLQSFFNGDLSTKFMNETIFPQLREYAKLDNGQYYYAFLILNLINTYTQNNNQFTNQFLDYFIQLFSVEEFLTDNISIFQQNTFVERLSRLRPDLSPGHINPEFQNLNVLNLSQLLNFIPSSNHYHILSESAEKFINCLTAFSQSSLIQGKDIVIDLPDKNKDLLFVQFDLATRLKTIDDVNWPSHFEDNSNIFTGYIYYINHAHNYVRIHLPAANP